MRENKLKQIDLSGNFLYFVPKKKIGINKVCYKKIMAEANN